MSSKPTNLKIEIPDIDPIIFEQRIIDGIPTINKEIKQKTPSQYWKELENKEKNESPNKKMRIKE